LVRKFNTNDLNLINKILEIKIQRDRRYKDALLFTFLDELVTKSFVVSSHGNSV